MILDLQFPVFCTKQTFQLFSLLNDTNLDWSKLKAFADDKLNVAKIVINVFDRVENIVGKGENAGYQHFLLFSCFVKASFSGSLKVGIVWYWFNDGVDLFFGMHKM